MGPAGEVGENLMHGLRREIFEWGRVCATSRGWELELGVGVGVPPPGGIKEFVGLWGGFVFRGRILGNGFKCFIINGQGLKQRTFSRRLVAIVLDFFLLFDFCSGRKCFLRVQRGERRRKKIFKHDHLGCEYVFLLPHFQQGLSKEV